MGREGEPALSGRVVLSIPLEGGMNEVRGRTMNNEVGQQGSEEQGEIKAKEQDTQLSTDARNSGRS